LNVKRRLYIPDEIHNRTSLPKQCQKIVTHTAYLKSVVSEKKEANTF